MEKFINYIQKLINAAWDQFDRKTREAGELWENDEITDDSYELFCDMAYDEYDYRLNYLYSLCVERQLPEKEIKKLFPED